MHLQVTEWVPTHAYTQTSADVCARMHTHHTHISTKKRELDNQPSNILSAPHDDTAVLFHTMDRTYNNWKHQSEFGLRINNYKLTCSSVSTPQLPVEPSLIATSAEENTFLKLRGIYEVIHQSPLKYS